jgi:amino-acid N-acetyltransferase
MAGRKSQALVRRARASDAKEIKALIDIYSRGEELLPRTMEEVEDGIGSFYVAVNGGVVVGAGALERYGSHLVEIRSLAVAPGFRRSGIGIRLAKTLLRRGARERIDRIFVMTLVPEFFERLGFTRVPHDDLPDKVWKDCIRCPHEKKCDEIALTRSLLS